MKQSTGIKLSALCLILSLFGCSGQALLTNTERTHAYVLETKSTAEIAMKAALRFFRDKGNPKDLLRNAPVPFEDQPIYTLNVVEKDLYQGSHPKDNAMLSEIQVTGKVSCVPETNQRTVLDYFIRETTNLNYSFNFMVKDQKIRIEYFGVSITEDNGKTALHDFRSNEFMVKTLDKCMGPLHTSLVKYINSKTSNW